MQQYNRHILTAPEPPVFSIRYFLYLFTRAKNLEQARLKYAISRIDSESIQNRYRIVESILESIRASV